MIRRPGFRTFAWFSFLAATSLCHCGCLLVTPQRGIPAQKLEMPLLQPPKSATVPLDLTLLKQKKPATHLIGPGDVLNVYVQGVLPPGTTATPTVHSSQVALGGEYYPPNGVIRAPSFGVPLEVAPNGVMRLPLIGEIQVSGLTIPQFENVLRQQYVSQGIIEHNRERIFVTLARARVHRVLVIREDSASDFPYMLSRQTVPYTKRGQAHVVDLPAFENDVLHALAATGGLPGIDAQNEVWILRGAGVDSMTAGANLEAWRCEPQGDRTAVRIPLRICPGSPLPFKPGDVILGEGDIVYVPIRDEYYYTAGLLPAGKIPLPRDDDLDVVQAIALSGGSVGGPGGRSGGAIFRSGGFGAVIPPSMVAVVRQLPEGGQVLIRVDLAEAMRDPCERITIQPGDIVYLHYTCPELFGNMLLNLFNFSFLVGGGSSL